MGAVVVEEVLLVVVEVVGVEPEVVGMEEVVVVMVLLILGQAPVTSVERLVISPVSAPREAVISVLTVRRKVICPENALSLGQQEEGVEAEEVEEIDLL